MQLLRNIKCGAIAILAIGVMAIQANGEIVHVAKKGETIFGIANMYHVSPDAILLANPQAQKGIKKGMSIVIPDGKAQPKSADKPTAKPTSADKTSTSIVEHTTAAPAIAYDPKPHADPVPHTASLTYLTSEGDNFDVISRKTGIDPGELMVLNPFLDPNDVPSGTLVRLSPDAPILDDSAMGDDINMTDDYAAEGDITREALPYQSATDTLAIEHKNVLIMLPFMSEADEQTKKAQLYTDFYRGFLIAAKNGTARGTHDIDVIVADTNDDMKVSQQEVSSLINHDVAVIIAPEDHAQIQMLADSAASRGIYVLNMFNFTDDTFQSNPWVIQGNINQSLMYDKAIEAVMTEYPGYVPVILTANGSREEKSAFTDALKSKYRNAGDEVLDIAFDEALQESDLAVIDPNKRYVFIPRSGSQTVFNRIAPAVLDLMEQEGGEERIELFGYPDWTAYRGESLELLQRMRAKVYSRFATDNYDEDTQQVQEEFIEWYGEPMIEAVPSQALLGYDVANYLIRAFRNGEFGDSLTDSYRGLQSTFKFKKTNPDGGYVNEALYLIEFLPGDRYSIKAL